MLRPTSPSRVSRRSSAQQSIFCQRSSWPLLGLVFVALCLVALAGCSANTGGDALLAARVSGHPVTLAQYDTMLRFTTASSGVQGQTADLQSPAGRGVLAADQQTALDWLVDRELAHVALAQQHLSIPQDEHKAAQATVDGYVAQIGQQAQMQPDSAQLRAMQAALTPEATQIIVDRLSSEQTLADKGTFPSAHLRVIIVDSQQTAKQLLQQVQKGADFGQLAHDKSMDSGTAAKNGEVGTVYVGQLASVINQAVFTPQAHSQKYVIVPIGTNYALLEVTDRSNAPLPKDQAAQNGTQIVESYLTTVVAPTSNVDQYVTVR